MRELKAALVLVDISGYTRFVMRFGLSLMHAEEIVTELLESVTGAIRPPLRLHKLEGDAAFLCADLDEATTARANDVARQIFSFHDAFRAKQAELFGRSDGGCGCAACQHVEGLRLKTVFHIADVVEKEVGGLRELAGEGVILAHRLLKNTIPLTDYVLMTKVTADMLEFAPPAPAQARTEQVEDFGAVALVVYATQPAALPPRRFAPFTRLKGYAEAARLLSLALLKHRGFKGRRFQHLPDESGS